MNPSPFKRISKDDDSFLEPLEHLTRLYIHHSKDNEISLALKEEIDGILDQLTFLWAGKGLDDSHIRFKMQLLKLACDAITIVAAN